MRWSVAGVLGVAALAGAWYQLSVRPSAERLDELWIEVEQAYDYLATEANLFAALDQERLAGERLQARFSEQQDRVGLHAGEVKFLSWLSRRAEQWDLHVKDYRPGGVVDYGDYRGYTLLLSGSGDYESLCHLLNELRRSEQLSRVASLNMAPIDEERSTLAFTIRIELLSKSPEANAAST